MFYRLPTKFAIQLPLVNLAILSFAPIILMLTNFWMFGNKQMFGSQIEEKDEITSIVQSDHTFG
jgi:hypothetical protein